jgi:fumarate reductase flavoprotein subunit
LTELDVLEAELERTGVSTTERAFNLTWHDWLNLKSLVTVSRVIAHAAAARQESRGAHYREDFPHTGPLDASAYTSIRADGGVTMKPVAFTRVRPGQTLLEHAA